MLRYLKRSEVIIKSIDIKIEDLLKQYNCLYNSNDEIILYIKWLRDNTLKFKDVNKIVKFLKNERKKYNKGKNRLNIEIAKLDIIDNILDRIYGLIPLIMAIYAILSLIGFILFSSMLLLFLLGIDTINFFYIIMGIPSFICFYIMVKLSMKDWEKFIKNNNMREEDCK